MVSDFCYCSIVAFILLRCRVYLPRSLVVELSHLTVGVARMRQLMAEISIWVRDAFPVLRQQVYY